MDANYNPEELDNDDEKEEDEQDKEKSLSTNMNQLVRGGPGKLNAQIGK